MSTSKRSLGKNHAAAAGSGTIVAAFVVLPPPESSGEFVKVIYLV
jgi:hypothetical protein